MNAAAIFKFIADLMPELVELGKALFELANGDVGKARADIKSRTAEIAAMNARVQEAIDAKFPPE